MNALTVRDLVKKYKSIEALKGISFEVRTAEIFALVGPNGAGKSTTLKIIATVLRPTSGSVSVFEHDLASDPGQIRKIISYLPEEAGAYKNLTGLEYLEFMAAIFCDDGKMRKAAVSFASEIAGLKDRLKDKVKTYSKGMTRKLLLARTVMTKPKFVILDEPTSGLDVINAVEVRKMIKWLSCEGISVLLSSHNMLEIEYLSDRMAIIDKGSILESGQPHDLKNKYAARNLEEVFIKIVS